MKQFRFLTQTILAYLFVLATPAAHAFNAAETTLIDGGYEEAQELDSLSTGTELNPIDPPSATTPPDSQLHPRLIELGEWAYSFRFYPKSAEPVVLGEYEASRKMKIASLMKVFTGWMVFHQPVLKASELALMLKESKNKLADQALNKLGGVSRLKDFLKMNLGLELKSEEAKVFNGSGNPKFENGQKVNSLMTTASIIEFLEGIFKNPQYSVFKTQLAIPGQDGTLRARLTDVRYPVFAKTGTLLDTPAANLAGYVELETGTLVFSIIGNELKLRKYYAKRKVRDNRGRVTTQIVLDANRTLKPARDLVDGLLREYIQKAEALEL